jgi:uncharacterized damage-inducible protein DinB
LLPGDAITKDNMLRGVHSGKVLDLKGTKFLKIMIFSNKKFITIIFCFCIISICKAQQSTSFASAIERQFNKIESDIVSSAEAMPEDKFHFTPEDLDIQNSKLKGVRTFAGQLMHLATDNILIWSAITGDAVRTDITDVNGPKIITKKSDVLNYLKSSFAEGRKAVSMITEKNAMDMIEFRGRNLPKLDLAFYALTHANEHYGQMVVYMRMCGIIPPPTLNER